MSARNKVIAGDYKGKIILHSFGQLALSTTLFGSMPLDRTTVENYEVMDESHNKSVSSVVGRGLVGGLLLGPLGMLAGGLSAKTKGVHIIALEFKDGKRSLLEVDDKVYKSLLKRLF